MLDPAVENMCFADPTFERLDVTLNFRDHPRADTPS
jgi:hypothetical protein